MGIRFTCPSGHKLHVKEFLAGKRGICPQCGAKFIIPAAPAAGEPASPAPIAASAGERPATTATISSLSQSVDVASPSVIIAVTESSIVSDAPPLIQPGPAAAVPSPRPSAILPPTVHANTQNAATNGVLPIVIADAAPPASPEQQYASRRDRRRQTQFKLAIGLLAAVVVLAAVLVWVLMNGPIQPAEPPAATSEPAATTQGVQTP